MNYNWPVIGHENIKKILQKGLDARNVGHAYLFWGPGKVGKTYLAKLFAQSLICDNFKKKDLPADAVLPCGKCDSCKQFEHGIYPDVNILEREQKEKTEELKANISVDQVRELIDKINKRAFQNSFKVAIIPEAETLGIEASNSLLKTLEEPTVQTVIILIAKNKDLILPTVQSRCQIMKFSPIKRDDIFDFLLAKNANREEALEYASLAQGRPTVAIKMLNDGDARQKYFEELNTWLDVLPQNIAERFKFADKYFKTEPDRDTIIDSFQQLSVIFRDLLLIKKYQTDLVAHVREKKKLETLAQKFSEQELCRSLIEIEKAKKLIRQNVTPKLVLEGLLVNMAI